ncbi:hypothetical protein E4U42_005134 [Claviceps africana]|uniref:C2H2-type domain-containing protein n=1 Tax=Claviceps africana TaxID=83212 RepID=A0A8K0J400_9HYPO|nr:hypothetical protein E4U42_005134 [Claviceps africana]
MYECDTCYREFATHQAVCQHMNALDHWAPVYPCETCDYEFRFEEDARDHMETYGHYRHYCKSCDRHFMNENCLRQASYTTASGLSHHLETGSCSRAPSLNRETILRAIRQRDAHGLITNRQIEWRDEEHLDYKATNQAFNGVNWECYLCHREFGSRNGLNQHLSSPRHKEKAYKCPNTRGGCQKLFASLAALFGHLESEQCSFMRFENVQKQAKRILDSRKMISF